MDLESALYTELNAITGLTGKGFALVAAQETQAPYFTYQLVSANRESDLIGGYGIKEAHLEINVYHAKYSDLKALIKLVISKVKSFSQRVLGGTGPVCQQLIIDNEHETYDSSVELYRGIIEITIYFEEV